MTGPHAYRYTNGRLEKADPYMNEGEIGYLPVNSRNGEAMMIIKVMHNNEPCFEFAGIMGGVDAYNFISDNSVNKKDFYIAIDCLAPMMIKFKQLPHGDDEIIDRFYSWDLNKNV